MSGADLWEGSPVRRVTQLHLIYSFITAQGGGDISVQVKQTAHRLLLAVVERAVI